MPLRHSNGPAPDWAVALAGPALFVTSLLGLLGFVLGGVHSFQDGAAVAAMIFLGGFGLCLSIEQYKDFIARHRKKGDADPS